MRFILSTGSLYNYSIDRVFALAAEAGFDGIEMMVDHRWDTRQSDYVRQLMDSHALAIPALHSPFSRNCQGWGETEFGAIGRTAELADELGAQVVVHHLPTRFGYAFLQAAGRSLLLPNPFDTGHQYAGSSRVMAHREFMLSSRPVLMSSCASKTCQPSGLWACASTLPAGTPKSRATLGDITRFPHITLDTTHLGTWGLDPVEAYSSWGQRVKHVHLSNYDGSEHCRPEDGKLRLDALLARMAADGYGYSISLELHPGALEAGAPDRRVVELLRGSLHYCLQAVGQGESSA